MEKEFDSDLILLDAPTLIESGLNKKCDKVIGVWADPEIRLQRICERDGLSLEDAKIRLNAGKDESFYKENTDILIYNNGEIPEFRKEISEILTEIKER